ncbi:MAG: YdcF family protein [Patescibacteria group bacterium]|jgi:uncharacterized SAM-binding protein YcdF (DUF218 family)
MNSLAAELQDMVLAQPPCKADAIIWLQGDRFNRAQKCLNLYQAGFAPLLVLTGNNQLLGKDVRPEEDNVSLQQMQDWLMERGVPEGDILIEDKSLNTRDQAVQMIDLAVSRNWSALLLVGSSYYQMRAFLTFLKYAQEMNWTGRIVNQPVIIPTESIPQGREKTAAEYFTLELEKINKYQDHVASIQAGVDYLNK